MSVDIKSTAKEQPELPFSVMTEKVLGPDYELSLVFNTPEEMQRLNKQYRQKEYVADILSFPLTETSGEIFMCLDQVRIKAAEYNQTFEKHVAFLFIHGLHHLKGLDHGSRMDKEEKMIRDFFEISGY